MTVTETETGDVIFRFVGAAGGMGAEDIDSKYRG